MERKIAVVGLGYVGLPVALALAKRFSHVVGFDIHTEKVRELKAGSDRTGEVPNSELQGSRLRMTSEATDLNGCDFFIVAVPTPVDERNQPDLGALRGASKTVGSVLKKGGIVVYESTVYPGVTEDICGPLLEAQSGLRCGVDFKLGYSPERINPGDREHSLERVVKVVSGQDSESLEIVAKVYEAVVEVGVHRAPSIKVAEAAKVIENTQRDLNIALMNELALIFDRLGIATRDVLAAAGTKWNFLKLTPGLVGGHCIGVDPYYLTSKAQELGYHPQVILAGRMINDGMGEFVAQRLIKLMAQSGIALTGSRVGIFGVTFKENVADFRNSRVPDIYWELKSFGIEPLVYDPFVQSHDAEEEYGITLSTLEQMTALDSCVLAVSHQQFLDWGAAGFLSKMKHPGVFIDVKSAFRSDYFSGGIRYWSL